MPFLNLFSKRSKYADSYNDDTIVIVGLGNPGEQYDNSPHNAGFLAVDNIADIVGALSWKNKFGGELSEARYQGKKILLFKPQTFMNKSGEAVSRLVRFYKIRLDSDRSANMIYVAHDDLDLELGTHKISFCKSGPEHNGIKSVTRSLGAGTYWRLRIGVMPQKKPAGSMADYLVRPAPRKFAADLAQSIADAARALVARLR